MVIALESDTYHASIYTAVVFILLLILLKGLFFTRIVHLADKETFAAPHISVFLTLNYVLNKPIIFKLDIPFVLKMLKYYINIYNITQSYTILYFIILYWIIIPVKYFGPIVGPSSS